MLIDFHTHIFPDAIAEHAVATLTAGIRREQGEDYHKGSPLNFRPATLHGLLDSMDTSHVTFSVCLPIATKPSQTESINHFAQTVRGERVLSFGTVHPDCEDAESILEDLKARGFIGIKLHPQFQRTNIDSPRCIDILRKAEELGLYTVLHAGADIGLPPPVFATPEKIRRALSKIDGGRIIAAHMGGWGQWDDVERFLIGTPIYLDTAFVKDFLSPQQCRRMIRAHGAHKILFGSDSPWEDPADTLAYLRGLKLSEEEMADICGGNAVRILGSTAHENG